MSFVNPPSDAYEILITDQRWGEDKDVWHIADIKLYGRSLEKDIKAIWNTGYSDAFPMPYYSKQEALQAAAELVQLHRDRCYSIGRD